MTQASLLGWVKAKGKPAKVQKLNKSNLTEREVPAWAYRFLQDFLEGIMTPSGPAGPFRKGDLVSQNALPPAVWGVLLQRGAVEPYRVNLDWPGPQR